MKRHIYQALLDWKLLPQRKPLLLRGARQVGKTHLVRQFGESFKHFVEINFESSPQIKTIFEKDLKPSRLVRDIQLFTGKPVVPKETLLFFDEIQNVPPAITALRYFYEELPELHVLGAGSLLDFTLENLGVPVGRVEFRHLYPVSFLEFLEASRQSALAEEILSCSPRKPLGEAVHQKILDQLCVYFAVGGMPEAVNAWLETEDLKACSKIHHNLIEAYRQDFHRYAEKHQLKYLDLLLNKIPVLAGSSFKFSSVSSEHKTRELAPSLELLRKAKIVHTVFHSSGQGVPLGAETNFKKFKVFFFDIALHQALLGLEIKSWILEGVSPLLNRGEIAESFIAQELLAYLPSDRSQQLYYWRREARSSQAEVDFLIEKQRDVIPIEVKSGKRARMTSAKIFFDHHPKSPYGILFSPQNYSRLGKILVYPLYAAAGALRQAEGGRASS